MLENRNPRTAVLFRSAVLLLMCGLWKCSALAAEARTQDQEQQDQDEAPDPLRPTDELLEELVEQALAEDRVVERYELVINVLDGSVTLYGTVDSGRERERAGAVAGDVSGVREVENRIRVAKELLPDVPSDEAIRERIMADLPKEGPEADVVVVVEDALATLTGAVSSAERRRELSELAFRAGAVLVRNELTVEEERKDGT